MFANPVLQQGKAENQAERPKHEQEDQRQRAEVSKKVLASPGRFDVPGNSRPRPPGIAIKPGGKAKLPADSAWKDDGLKRIQQDEENEKNAGNGGKNHHGTMVMLRPEMVADLVLHSRDRYHIFSQLGRTE